MAQTEEILDAAVTGIPRVAKVIAEIPTEHRERALEAADGVTSKQCGT